MVFTSGWASPCLASPSPSTSPTSSGSPVRAGRWRDWCQVEHWFRDQDWMRNISGIISPVANEDVKNKHKAAIGEYFHCNKRRHAMYGARNVEHLDKTFKTNRSFTGSSFVRFSTFLM